MAGTGKSTIARTVARTCANQKRLGASFFFSRGQEDLSRATKFITSLAHQLVNTLPALRRYVCSAIVDNPDITEQGLSEQWKHLILQSLANVKDISLQSQLLVFVIDALDECEGEDDIRLILRLLAEVKSINTIRLRIFITSRPELTISFSFHDISDDAHQDFILHKISQSIIEQDVLIFFNHELGGIRKNRCLPEDWPAKAITELLVQRADRLFIYAATICRFLCNLHLRTDQMGRRIRIRSRRAVHCRRPQLGGDRKRCQPGRLDT